MEWDKSMEAQIIQHTSNCVEEWYNTEVNT